MKYLFILQSLITLSSNTVLANPPVVTSRSSIQASIPLEVPDSCQNDHTHSDFDRMIHYLQSNPGDTLITQHFSCEDLFSEHPPEPIARVYGSRLSAAEWSPFCSLTYIASKMNEINSYEGLINNYLTFSHHSDLCGTPNDFYANINSITTPNPTRPIIPQLSARQKRSIIQTFNRIKARMQNTCCGNNRFCNQKFSEVPLIFCGELAAFNAANDTQFTCARIFSAYYLINMQNYILNKFIVITNLNESAYLNNLGGVRTNFETAVAHELAHSCETIHAIDLAQKRASQRFFNVFNQSSSCQQREDQRYYFEQMFQNQNLNIDSINCIHAVILNSEHGFFDQNRHCNNCIGINYKEAFANLLELKDALNNANLEGFYASTCYGAKDSEHPLNRALLGCYLKTPSFRQQLARRFGCQNRPAATAQDDFLTCTAPPTATTSTPTSSSAGE